MTYQEAKQQLKAAAQRAIAARGKTLDANFEIQQELDGIIREINRTATSEAKARQQSQWLDLYCVKLQPSKPRKGGRK